MSGDSSSEAARNGESPALVSDCLSVLAEEARYLGMRRIHILAWRDLEDPEAGGSELHAHRIASQWASTGLDISMWTSRADGHSSKDRRAGYSVERRGGRYAVFPRCALFGSFRFGRNDGVVEIWNGMPFFSPVWAPGPRVVFLHHIHAEMWQMTLTPKLAKLGRFLEERVAPPFYRRSRIITLSDSSRDEIVSRFGIRPDRVSVVPPGVEARFSPGGELSETPLVVGVGRLVPVKRFAALMDSLAKVHAEHPALRAVIVGEGYERQHLEAHRRALGAESWLDMPGKLSDDELVDIYRRAWIVVSSSQREGWGMTITEAGACGTPAIATRITGHADAIEHGKSGYLVDDPEAIADSASEVIADHNLRSRLAAGARSRASRLTWEATATGTLSALVDEARRRRKIPA